VRDVPHDGTHYAPFDIYYVTTRTTTTNFHRANTYYSHHARLSYSSSNAWLKLRDAGRIEPMSAIGTSATPATPATSVSFGA
jgi:hypothetical protein